MQFVHTPYFSGYTNPQQQQQQQQQQQPHSSSPHSSQSPTASTAQVEQQPPTTPNLAIPAALQSFTQAAGLPIPGTTELNSQGKPKRKQVKNACVNCQKACKKCDDGRPCQRCVKYGLVETCVNSVRKERKKGIKRGPYKKRKQADGSAGTESPSSTAPASSLTTGLYAPTSQAATASGVRTNGVLAYQPFQSSSYEAFHAAAVSYQNSASMMPHAYMVPAAIQQMYPTNPILSYQAAMNMLSPQHGQTSPNIYGYRPDGTTQAAPAAQQAQDQQADGQNQQQQQQHRSHEGSPATPTGVSTPNSGIKAENTPESDDEGSKLNILSQLCSAVLDRAPDTPQKQEEHSSHEQTPQGTSTAAQETQSTPPANNAATVKAEDQKSPC